MEIVYTFVPPNNPEKLEHFEVDIRRALYHTSLGEDFSDLTVRMEEKKGWLRFWVQSKYLDQVPSTLTVTSCELDHSKKNSIPVLCRVCETFFVRYFSEEE